MRVMSSGVRQVFGGMGAVFCTQHAKKLMADKSALSAVPNGATCPKVLSGRSQPVKDHRGQNTRRAGDQTDRIPWSVAFSSRMILTPARRGCKRLPAVWERLEVATGRVQNSGYPHTGFSLHQTPPPPARGRRRRSRAVRVRRGGDRAADQSTGVGAWVFPFLPNLQKGRLYTAPGSLGAVYAHWPEDLPAGLYFSAGTRRKAVPFASPQKVV